MTKSASNAPDPSKLSKENDKLMERIPGEHPACKRFGCYRKFSKGECAVGDVVDCNRSLRKILE